MEIATRPVLFCYDNYEYIANFELEVKLILQRLEVYKLRQFIPGVKMAYTTFTPWVIMKMGGQNELGRGGGGGG